MASLAKITVPALPNVYTRQRLFRLLDEHRQYQAIWLTGAPGDGKTTTVVSYLSQSDLQPVWYRCDEGDADPATLFYYLGIAAKELGTNLNLQLPAFAPEYAQGLPVFARRFFRELFSALPSPFALVLDNYQDIAADAAVHELLQAAIEELPQRSVIVFVSRSEPPGAFSRLRANGVIGVIGSQAIRFDTEEAEALVRGRCNGQASDERVQQIVEQTRGWAAGMVLLCAAGHSPSTVMYTRHADIQVVFDYFASEIFRKLDTKTQNILLMTALLPMTTADMAQKLSGDDNAGWVLEYLYQNSYFTLRDAQAEPVYQYHPLFRQFLIRRGEELYANRHLAKLKSRAVLLLMASGQWEAAVDLCRAVQDWTMLSRLLQDYGPSLVRQGRYATLAMWLDGVSEPVFAAHAWLQYWRGVVLLPYEPWTSQPIFENAFRAFRSQRDVTGIFRAWTAMVESIRSDSRGNNSRLDPWIALLDELITVFPRFPDADIECEVACGMLASLYYRAPQDPRLPHWKERAIGLSMTSSNLHQRASVMQWAIMHDLLRGDHARASLYMTVFRSSVQGAEQDPRIASASNFALVYYQARTGQFDAALDTMQHGLELSRTSGAAVWSYQMLAHGTTAAIGKGDLALAEKLLVQMEPFARVASGFAPLYYHILVSWRALLVGDVAKAVAHAEAAVTLTHKAAFILFDGYALYGLAQALFQWGDKERAHQLLRDALALAQKIESRIFEHMCRLVEADFAFAEGRDEEGTAALRIGMALGKQEQYINLTYWMPPMMSRVCAQALARDIEPEYAAHIIRERKLTPPDAGTEDWPWPVRIVTLDQFSVLVDGNPLPFSRKTPKKLIALLKAIVAFGGRDVSVGRLVDALWPEQDADIGNDALEKALQRLRKMIGDDALILKGGRINLNPKVVWTDVWSFERLINLAGGQASEAMEKAIALYRRDFLFADDDAPWALTMRERVHAAFIRAVSKYCRHLMDSGDYQGAIELYQNAISVDNLAEELYQGALNCYVCTGRYVEGIALYRRLRQTLSITLGVQPSAATEEIHQALLQQKGPTVRLMQR